jgi:hypothetical protein
MLQTSGLFKIDKKTGEIFTALPLTGKGRQVRLAFVWPLKRLLLKNLVDPYQKILTTENSLMV